MARKRAGRYHHGDLSRSLLEEALRTIEKDGRRFTDAACGGRQARRVAHGALSSLCRQVGAAGGGGHGRISHAAPPDAGGVGHTWRGPQGTRSDGRCLRPICRRASVALPSHVRRLRAERRAGLGPREGRSGGISGTRRRDRGAAEGGAGFGATTRWPWRNTSGPPSTASPCSPSTAS